MMECSEEGLANPEEVSSSELNRYTNMTLM